MEKKESKDHLLVFTDDEYAVLIGAFATWFRAVEMNIPLNKRPLVESVLRKLGFQEQESSKIQIVRS